MSPHKTPELRKKYKLKHLYNISLNDYELMYKNQNGICPGCGEKKKLCVDHCHITGIVRGLLCRQCNAVIGLAKEDIQIIKNLVNYLER